MRKLLFLSTLLLCGRPVAAAHTGTCDATPFTLGKPASVPPKADQAASQTASAATPAKKPEVKAKPKPQPKPRLLATCKDAKTKKGG